MTLKMRFSLIGIGIVIFLIIIPPLILFAGGFKIDLENHRLVKTGSLVAETEPGRTLVYLDNKKQRGVTPSTIRFLFPKDYEVRIEKENYQPWTKRLSVKSQLVTWVNLNRKYIALFLSQPINIQTLKADGVYPSFNQQELIFNEDSNLYSLSMGGKEAKQLGPITNLSAPYIFNDQLIWENGKKVFETFTGFSQAKSKSPQIQALIPTEIKSNGKFTLVKIGDRVQLLSSDSAKILESNISTFRLQDNLFWFIKNSSLENINLETNERTLISANLPEFNKGQIIRSNGHVFLILDEILYFANTELERIATGVVFSKWNYGSNKLLIATNNAVTLFDPENQKTDLIHRSVSIITNPILNAETGYVFFSNEGKIKAIELDGRDQRNVFDIADSLSGFTLSDDGKMLYVFDDSIIKIFEIR